MKCIILCAGKGTRMFPITNHVPKCLVQYNGKNLLEHKLDSLPLDIDEVYIVIGHLGEMIMNYFGDGYRHFKIKYIWMKDLNGTGGAINLIKNYIKSDQKFLVLMGDDIYSKEDLKEVAEIANNNSNLFIGVYKSKNIEGRPMFFDDNDYLVGFDSDSNLENTGLYVLDKNYFDLESVYVKEGKEISIPHTLVDSSNKYKIKKFLLRKWKKVNSISDLEN